MVVDLDALLYGDIGAETREFQDMAGYGAGHDEAFFVSEAQERAIEAERRAGLESARVRLTAEARMGAGLDEMEADRQKASAIRELRDILDIESRRREDVERKNSKRATSGFGDVYVGAAAVAELDSENDERTPSVHVVTTAGSGAVFGHADSSAAGSLAGETDGVSVSDGANDSISTGDASSSFYASAREVYDALRMFKELLDDGIITQGEYDALRSKAIRVLLGEDFARDEEAYDSTIHRKDNESLGEMPAASSAKHDDDTDAVPVDMAWDSVEHRVMVTAPIPAAGESKNYRRSFLKPENQDLASFCAELSLIAESELGRRITWTIPDAPSSEASESDRRTLPAHADEPSGIRGLLRFIFWCAAFLLGPFVFARAVGYDSINWLLGLIIILVVFIMLRKRRKL